MCAQALEILISEFTVDIHGILIQTRRLDGRETWLQLNINSVRNASSEESQQIGLGDSIS